MISPPSSSLGKPTYGNNSSPIGGGFGCKFLRWKSGSYSTDDVVDALGFVYESGGFGSKEDEGHGNEEDEEDLAKSNRWKEPR